MNYKKFGNTGVELSVLGFGAMRFPVDENENIIEDEAIKMIRYGIDNGINYVDTAWPYHGGQSEPLVGKALKDGYREKTYLATKLPSWLINKPEDFDDYLNQQLEKLQTDSIDFYLVHAINENTWKDNLLKNNLFDFLDRILKDGRVKHVGFSFHDTLALFKEIVDAYDWSFTQIQYNFIDHDYQAGLEGLKYANEKGLAVISMEPLRGGSLANDIPDDMMKIWKDANATRTPVEWALKYVWSYPEIGLLLSGMSTMEQVKENIMFASKEDAMELSDKEKETVYKVKHEYLSRIQVHCTACKYCMPCPHGVNIPGVFKYINDASIFDQHDFYKERYFKFMSEDSRATACIACGECLSKCPQKIDIVSEMKRVVEVFG